MSVTASRIRTALSRATGFVTAALLACTVACGASAPKALAANLDNTGTTEDQIVHAEKGDLDEGLNTYSIRIYSGNRGLINNEDHFEWKKYFVYGDKIDLSKYNLRVEISDSKYYAKGIRLAGYDNVKDVRYAAKTDERNFLTGIITVTGDADYVVAYGVAADRVAYTIRYVDRHGREIAQPQMFYGDIGDRPAASAAYVEGYVPTSYEIVRTLSADAGKNVFTFVYNKLGSGYTTNQAPTGTVEIVTPTGTRVPAATASATGANRPTTLSAEELMSRLAGGTSGTSGTSATGTGADGTAADGTSAAGSATPVTGTAISGSSALARFLATPAGEAILDEEGEPIAQPIETDIQDNAVAMASYTGESSEEVDVQSVYVDRTPNIVAIVAAGLGVVLLVAAIVIFMRKRAEERLWASW